MLQLRTRTDEDHILHQAHPGPDLSTEITLNYRSGTNGDRILRVARGYEFIIEIWRLYCAITPRLTKIIPFIYLI